MLVGINGADGGFNKFFLFGDLSCRPLDLVLGADLVQTGEPREELISLA